MYLKPKSTLNLAISIIFLENGILHDEIQNLFRSLCEYQSDGCAQMAYLFG